MGFDLTQQQIHTFPPTITVGVERNHFTIVNDSSLEAAAFGWTVSTDGVHRLWQRLSKPYHQLLRTPTRPQYPTVLDGGGVHKDQVVGNDVAVLTNEPFTSLEVHLHKAEASEASGFFNL